MKVPYNKTIHFLMIIQLKIVDARAMSFRRVPTLRASLGHPAKRRLLATKSAEVYERKTPLEHVLLRPGMYIGSVESVKTPLWVLSKEAGSRVS